MTDFTKQLIKQADRFQGGLPKGMTGSRLLREGFYEEAGLTLTREDVAFTRLYAALAIYSREVYLHSESLIGTTNGLIVAAVEQVEQMEKRRWGNSAYPYQQPGFPFTAELARFPTHLAQASLSQQLDLTILDDPDLLHEWTLKAGRRLFEQYLARLKPAVRQAICHVDGPYGYVKDKKPVHDVLDATVPIILSALLTQGGGEPLAEALLAPVAVCVAVILVKKGLRAYCEPEAKG